MERSSDGSTRARALLSALASPLDGDPLPALAERVAHALGVRCALIAECVDSPPTRVRTLAFWDTDRLAETFEYGLEGTPCAEVVAGTECFHPSAVTASFPGDTDLRRLGAESYLGVPLTDPSGEVVGHVAVLHDKPLEEDLGLRQALRIFATQAILQLERRRARAAGPREPRALLASGDAAGSVAHAIGNPLAALIGTLELAIESGGADPSLSRSLRLAGRIRRVVERTLLLFREGELRRSELDPAGLIDAICSEVKPRAQRQRVSITLHRGAHLGPVSADSPLLQTALAALVDNALDAMPDGGALSVGASTLETGGVEFRIADSGPGVPAPLGHSIFRPFFSTRSGGTGLGLSIAQRVVLAHGGRVRVERRPGGGALMIVELPPSPED